MEGFDPVTGQMYTEAQVRVRSRHHSDWIGELKTPSLAYPLKTPNKAGARSLAGMAIAQAAHQIRDLTPEHFAHVPWRVAEPIWRQITETRRESFHAWRIFATAFPAEMATNSNRYYLQIRQPSLQLDSYLGGIKSEAVRWLVCLRISPKETRSADLASVANVTNLAILDLSDGQVTIDMKTSAFDERLMRSWAEVAASRRGFANLRVLLLGWQNLDTWLFKYLPFFPALSCVVITDSQKLTQRNRKDWESLAQAAGLEARHAKRSAKSLRPILDDLDFYRYSVSGFLFDESQPEGDPQPSPKHRHRPVLECWLGTPRKWTHILEDFPSTRTIFFDRSSLVNPDYSILYPQPVPNTHRQGRGPLHTSKVMRSTSRSSYRQQLQPASKPRRQIPGLSEMLNGTV
jgi:hypothetical protein